MKLSTETLEILNSFRDINQSIVIYPGNMIRTKSEDNRILAEAFVEEEFDREFAFYQIKGFLDAYNILGSPDLIFSEENYVLLKEGKSEIKYYYCEPSLVTSPSPELNFQLKTKDVCFQLSQLEFNKMMRMTTFDSDRKSWIVDFLCENKDILLNVYHKNDVSKPSYSTIIGESDNRFCFRSYLDSFFFINGSYDIVISKANFLEAVNTKRNLRYILPLSPESTFEE
jgi:hypothetical protein